MCGIAGFVSTADSMGASSLDAVRRMTSRMRPRGPDAEGVCGSAKVPPSATVA
jgi:asparagine synthetase B (glutamine-hydrolysing)